MDFGVDEVVELALPSSLSPVMRMTYLLFVGSQIGVGVDQGLAHALGVVDVLAEDDGLGDSGRWL